MKINLYNIYYYYLTCDNKIRKDHITNEFKNFKLVEVNPIMNIGKIKSGATGFSRILDQACIHQDKNKPFQPFAIFEDDVKKFDEFPLEIEIPNDTDILYIGLSMYGMNKSGDCTTVCSRNINDDIIRVYNMLAFHGIIVCSIRGLLTLQKCMFESYFKNKIWDIYTAQIQPYLNVYALKKPLVYQYGKIGGQERPTKINYIDKADIPISKEWINKDNLSILTFNNKEIIPNRTITCFSYSNNNRVYNITYPIITSYCKLHNYEFIPYHNNLETNYKPHWNKLHYSIKLLRESKSDYIVWFDHDIVIKNFNIKLEDIIHKYKFNECEALFMMSKDPVINKPFNTGVIVFKNNKKTLNTFEKFLEIRDTPLKYPSLKKHGGFDFKNGLQDTRVMACYFEINKTKLLSIPHKVLQSFYGMSNFYSSGDFCGHVAGPQNDKLINYLNELINLNDNNKEYSTKDNEESNNFIRIGNSETNSKTIRLYKQYPHDTIITFKHRYEDTFDYKFEDNKLTITRTDKNSGWGQDLVAYLSFSSDNLNINSILKDLGPIEKKIHISWKTKDILDLDFTIIKYGIKQLKDLNPEYIFEISDNNDVEKFIKNHISNDDYDLIKDRNIVEKVDLWRLLKIYHEGGFYMDIDRLCNISFKDIINSEHKCILPMHHDIDFSQDIMMSSSKNIIFKEAIGLNLKRRRDGCTDILSLGPITYFHAITKILLGNQIPRYSSKDYLIKLRSIISNCKYLSTFREVPPYNTLVYRGPHISFDKAEFYEYCDVNHWTKNNPNNPDNKPYGN